MLPSTPSQLCRIADATRLVAQAAAWDASNQAAPRASYFYGYWFSHWRA